MKTFINRLKILLLISCFFITPVKAANIRENSEEFKDLSIIIPSWDNYAELWDPMFSCLFKYWPNLNNEYKNVPIYLVSNSKKFDNPRITNVSVGDLDKTWSSNFLKGLESVKTKYVLLILDDYFLVRPVNNERLVEAINLVRNTNGAYFVLSGLCDVLNDGNEVPGYKNIKTRDLCGECRTALQAAIWDVSVLKSLLNPNETIWNFEGAGSKRSESIKQPFYYTSDNHPFQYYNAVEAGKLQKHAIEHLKNVGVNFIPKMIEVAGDCTSCFLFTPTGADDFIKSAKGKFNIPIKGVIHIGAFDGGEIGAYKQIGIENFLWVEADPDAYKKLVANVKPNGTSCITENFAASNKAGVVKFHRTNNEISSSLLELKIHKVLAPDVVHKDTIEIIAKPLDYYVQETKLDLNRYNGLVLDIQGAELMALEGAVNTLKTIDFIVTEINYSELYKGAVNIIDLDKFLLEQGFIRADTISAGNGWGDALYVRGKFFAKE